MLILLNSIIVDYFILLCHDYLFSIVFIILFLFSFLFFYQFYFHPSNSIWSCLHLLLYLVFVLFCLLSFLLLFILRYHLSLRCRVKTNSFVFVSTRHTWKHVLIFFFFKGTCFKFYLIALLTFYLYFIRYRGTHNVSGTQAGVFSGQFHWGLPWTWQEMKPGCVFNFQGVLYY